MGGHGGLNILPQKKWNVYNRDNRQRVARDEAAHAEKERELADRHAAAEREVRLQALKSRARQRHGGAATINLDDPGALPPAESPMEPPPLPPPPVADAMAALEAAEPRATKRRRRERPPAPSPPPHSAAAASAPPRALPKFVTFEAERPQHINLFAAVEAAAGRNPEREAERRRDSARRGDPATQTSDPRFDESFGLALRGGAAAPWYAAARPRDAPPGSGPPAVGGVAEWTRRGAAALAASAAAAGEGEGELRLLRGVRVLPGEEERNGGKKRHRGTSGSSSDGSSSGEEGRSRRWRGKERGRKERRQRREQAPPAADKWAALREERLRREEAERVREREAVRAATGRGGPGGRRYHSGFGHGR